ncbi:MAG: VWA domain-containing protein, partial [Anaerolineae bacterium]|nr:VWA domain-containing protein [Anaerolineae bacterium]
MSSRTKRQCLLIICAVVLMLCVSTSSVPSALAHDQPPGTTRASPYDAATRQPPTGADIILVIDRSGSMAGQKLDDAKLAASQFVDFMLFPPDQIGVVSFSDAATVDHALDQDPEGAQAAIAALVSDGGTAIHLGIQAAHTELIGPNHIPSNVQAMIILSDGGSDYGSAVGAADAAKADGIRIFSIGLGADVDADLMRDIASSPDDYYFAPSGEQLAEIYALISNLINPVPQDALVLAVAERFSYQESAVVKARAFNDQPVSRRFTVTVTLLEGGLPLDTQTQTTVVVWSGWAQFLFDFGPRPLGDYLLQAELADESGPVTTELAAFSVVDDFIYQLLDQWGRALREIAYLELDTMRSTVSTRFGYAAEQMPEKTFSFLLTLFLRGMDGLTKIQAIKDVIGEVDVTLTLQEQLDALRQKKALYPNQCSRVMDVFLDEMRLNAEKTAIQQRHEDYVQFVQAQPIPFSPDVHPIFAHGFDEIRSTSERDNLLDVVISPAGLLPSISTLQQQAWEWDLLQQFEGILGIVVLVVTLIVFLIIVLKVILVFVAGAPIAAAVKISLGSIVVSLKQLFTLKFWLQVGQYLTATILLTSSLAMAFGVIQIAPHVTQDHAETLDAVEALLAGPPASAAHATVHASVFVDKKNVNLVTTVGETSQLEGLLLETVIYSVDGRIIDILYNSPDQIVATAGQLSSTLALPQGAYKAVTALHTTSRIALATDTQPFVVEAAELALQLSLQQTHVAPGDPVRFTVQVQNNSANAETNVGLLVYSDDQETVEAWGFDIDAYETKLFEGTFIAPDTGSYVLYATLLAEESTYLVQSAGYVVGDGPAFYVNPQPEEVYAGGAAVDVPIMLGNGGSQSTAGSLTISTLDLDTPDFAEVYHTSVSYNLAPGVVTTQTRTVLPAASTKPGAYVTQLLVDGNPYAIFPFTVAAADTLYTEIRPQKIAVPVGTSNYITVTVIDSTYVYTDANVSVEVVDPYGDSHGVPMSWQSTGVYRGNYAPGATGTHLVNVAIDKTRYRGVGGTTFFVAGYRSTIMPVIQQGLVYEGDSDLVLTTKNEVGVALAGVEGVLSNDQGTYVALSGENGRLEFSLRPTSTQAYKLTLSKPGYLTTILDVPVEGTVDTTPPYLLVDLDHGARVNTNPVAVTGLTEPGAIVRVDGLEAFVDGRGLFTGTAPLLPGDNIVTVAATDSFTNTTTVTRAVILDQLPPALSISTPPDGFISHRPGVLVAGTTDTATLVLVNELGVEVDAAGYFDHWVQLRPGTNDILVQALDEAGNETASTVHGSYILTAYLPIVTKSHYAPPTGYRLKRAIEGAAGEPFQGPSCMALDQAGNV